MQIGFTLFRIVAAALSYMPFWMMYIFSGVFSLVLRTIARYRYDVIISNLKNAFPDKSSAEIKHILSRYYRNLADITLEIIKLRRISPRALKGRFEFRQLNLMSSALDSGKSVIIATGHCGNWEWMGTALGLVTSQKGYALTKPLSDKNFHDYMERLRHRLNPNSTIPFKSAFREMVRLKNTPSFYVIAADQTPTLDEANYWTPFFNQDTAFFMGIEKIARALDTHVIFMDVQRTGRGKYRGTLQLISDAPAETADHEITERYVHLLESSIRKDPANWLWSHRRWKHKKPSVEI